MSTLVLSLEPEAPRPPPDSSDGGKYIPFPSGNGVFPQPSSAAPAPDSCSPSWSTQRCQSSRSTQAIDFAEALRLCVFSHPLEKLFPRAKQLRECEVDKKKKNRLQSERQK